MVIIDDKKELRRKLLKNTLINFIIFTAILLIFDFVIYNQVLVSLYEDVDKQLQSSVRRNIPDDINIPDRIDTQVDDKKDEKPGKEMMEKTNPRIIMIKRDSSGEISNEDNLGNLSEYSSEIKFNQDLLNTIYNIQIGNQYSYRAINFEESVNGEITYNQILINVDGEAATLENMKNILILGTVILSVISIGLSYGLSKRTMKPMIESYRKQTEFVQNASHELRTPLTIIQAKQELLLTDPNAKIIDKSEDINLTLKETRRLTKLIKELMDLARADSSNEDINKEMLDINKVIREMVNPYVEMAEMQKKTIELDLKCNKKVNINVNKINELMVIILDNALKYTNENDKITIKTYNKDGKCNIEVQDTGIGISDEGVQHIFDRFYREDKARSRQTGGNGLGLAIAKTIVNMHNGTIKAMHNNPKGTIILCQLAI